jgi:cytochrome c
VKLLVAGVGLLLPTCSPSDSRPTPADLATGKRAYQKCYSCHALEPGRNDLAGPTLYGIVGRAVAAESGFDYSPALKRFAEREPRWTRKLLDRFAEEPEALVPGTSMSFHGISDDAERGALLDYLERQTSPSVASLP